MNDVYEVFGQVSRSVKWLHAVEKLFNPLMGRYQQSLPKGFDRMFKCHDHDMILD